MIDASKEHCARERVENCLEAWVNFHTEASCPIWHGWGDNVTWEYADPALIVKFRLLRDRASFIELLVSELAGYEE
jgi:hypothetical protein